MKIDTLPKDEIRKKYLTGKYSKVLLSELYGVSEPTITKLTNDIKFAQKGRQHHITNPARKQQTDKLTNGLDKGKICALYRAGWAIDDIGSDVMGDARDVLAVLKENDLR